MALDVVGFPLSFPAAEARWGAARRSFKSLGLKQLEDVVLNPPSSYSTYGVYENGVYRTPMYTPNYCHLGFLIQKIIVHPGIWDPNQSGPNKFHDIPFGIVWFGWVEDKSGISGTSSMLHAAFFSSQAKYFTEPSGKSRQNSFRILATSDKINGNFLCPRSHQTNLELSSLPTRRSISSKLLISQLRWQLHSPCSNPGSSFSMDMYVSMQLGNGCRVQRPKDVSQCEVRGRRLVIKSRIYW